jgi:hypothetical protein
MFYILKKMTVTFFSFLNVIFNLEIFFEYFLFLHQQVVQRCHPHACHRTSREKIDNVVRMIAHSFFIP